ncbi:divalent-cation tolerance protein CutA [Neiella sp. HB171785]|uniref:Divalent-cation tolerance protein CutA n=1 Tax=Neiella litorisoli TaxID=2771431 RepID=A0A8J6QHM1_9GAMM|nr:divalent-cation tolerance protein CutA [Neiella litorisoli]MBD1387851.1 divalent-cation tolerance protein CutA [Neiella litorisoli]
MTNRTNTQPSNDEVRVVLTTCASTEQGEQLAQDLLSADLVACVNMLPPMQSFYRWQGQLCNEMEVQLVIKTRAEHVEAIKSWLAQHHPYDTPEVLVLSVADASLAYHQWIKEVC